MQSSRAHILRFLFNPLLGGPGNHYLVQGAVGKGSSLSEHIILAMSSLGVANWLDIAELTGITGAVVGLLCKLYQGIQYVSLP